MVWNHRVIRRYADINGVEEPFYTIHEVYYDEDGSMSWTINEVAPFGDTVEGLQENLRWMLEACQQPVLDIKELERYAEARRKALEANPPKEEKYVSYATLEELLEDLENGE